MRSFLVMLLLCVACGKGDPQSNERNANENSSAVPSDTATAAPKETTATDGQSFAEGMQALCESIDAVPRTLEPAEQQRQVAAWIGAHVTNPQVRELFAIIGDMPADQRPGMLGAAAAKAGLQNCALAER